MGKAFFVIELGPNCTLSSDNPLVQYGEKAPQHNRENTKQKEKIVEETSIRERPGSSDARFAVIPFLTKRRYRHQRETQNNLRTTCQWMTAQTLTH